MYTYRVFIVKTLKGVEKIAASYIRDIIPECDITVKPGGYSGILLVKIHEKEKHKARFLYNIPEIEKIIPVEKVTKAELKEICLEAKKLAEKYLNNNITFAVRTTRRGKHDFTSLDVNIKIGSCIQEIKSNKVDLKSPDKIFWIEIIDNYAYISVISQDLTYRKKTPEKPGSLKFLKKTIIVQTPYLDDKASYKIGIRIGRTVQSYEIPLLIVAPYGQINALQLMDFLKGINEGILSRYKLQLKAYNDRKVSKTQVYLQDLYQFIRNINREKEGIIITTTKGKISTLHTKNIIKRLYQEKKKIYVLIGSNQGIPTGLYRQADVLLDIAPNITLATDVAVPSIISTILNIVII